MKRPDPPRPRIVIDTREQVPWTFDPEHVDVMIGTLQTGDYSLFDHETEVAIERKTLDDYVQTVIRERERFERELARMQSHVLRAVIVEAAWRDVRDHNYISQVHPSSVFGLTCCLMVDYGVPVLFAEDTAIAARVCERMIRRYAENIARAAESAEAKPPA